METGKYPYDLVEIIWDDAEVLEAGWESPPTDLKESLAVTVGFLVKKTKKHVMICHTSDGNNINGRIQIPKGMIKSLKTLVPASGTGSTKERSSDGQSRQ